jgi:hypothetical protein
VFKTALLNFLLVYNFQGASHKGVLLALLQKCRNYLFIALMSYSTLWFCVYQVTAGKWKWQLMRESELNEQQREIRRRTNKLMN